MIKTLTAEFVKKEVLPAKKGRIEYWDDELPGFGLRVTKTGVKTFCAVYRVRGRKRRLTLGTYPTVGLKAARAAAKDALCAAQLGKDAAAEKQADRAGLTFGALADDYLEGHAKAKKKASSIYADIRMINSDLAAWKDRKAADITNADVSLVLRGIVKRGAPIKANRVLALLSKIFRHGIGTGILARGTISPTYLVPRPSKECSRDRVLTDDEIKKLWKALDGKPFLEATWFKLLLLTGQRCREVLTMARAEVDFEMGEWTVPAGSEDHKSKRENLLPLSPSALALIEDLKKHEGSHSLKGDHPFLFPARSVNPAPLRFYKKWVNELRDELKFKPDWTAHDLRRTVQTNLTKMGASRFIAEKVLNHADNSVGGVYDRYAYKDEKRDALTKWDKRLAEIVGKA